MGIGRGGISGSYVDAGLAVCFLYDRSVKVQAVFLNTAIRDPGNIRAKSVDSGHAAYICHVVGIA